MKPASRTGSNKVSLGEDEDLGAAAVKKDSAKISLGEGLPEEAAVGPRPSQKAKGGPASMFSSVLSMAPTLPKPTASNRRKVSLGEEVPSDLGAPASAKSSRGKVSLGEEAPV